MGGPAASTANADDDRPILLKTEMLAGHGWSTGHSQREGAAFRMARLMDQLGADLPRSSGDPDQAR